MTISSRRQHSFISSSAITLNDAKSVYQLYKDNPQFKDRESEHTGIESINKKLYIHIGDITDMKLDAIVCPTQTDLTLKPVGLAKTVLARGGSALSEACMDIGSIKAGRAKKTLGYNLQSKYVLHTAGVSPDSSLTYSERKRCLAKSYNSCLKIVSKHDSIRTVAFPCLGSGGGSIPLKQAIRIATTAIRTWLESPDNLNAIDGIIVCMYDEAQWDEYFPQLIYTFPYGPDIADIEQERRISGSSISQYSEVDGNTSEIQQKHSPGDPRQPTEGDCSQFISGAECSERNSRTPSSSLTACKQTYAVASEDHFSDFSSDYRSDSVSNIKLELSKSADLNKERNEAEPSENTWSEFSSDMQSHRTLDTRSPSSAGIGHTKQSYQNETKDNGRSSPTLVNKFLGLFRTSKGPQNSNLTEPRKGAKSITSKSIGNGQNDDKTCKKTLEDRAESDSDDASSIDSDNDVTGISTCRKQATGVKSAARAQLLDKDNVRTATENSDYGFVSDRATTSSERCTDKVCDSLNTDQATYSGIPKCVAVRKKKKLQARVSNVHNTTVKSAAACDLVKKTQNVNTTQDENFRTGVNRNHVPKQDIGTGESGNNLNIIPDQNCETDESGSCNNVSNHKSRLDYNGSWGLGKKLVTLNDRTLMRIARCIGSQQLQLGIELGLSFAEVQAIQADHVNDVIIQGFCILNTWKCKSKGSVELEKLVNAMRECQIDVEAMTFLNITFTMNTA